MNKFFGLASFIALVLVVTYSSFGLETFSGQGLQDLYPKWSIGNLGGANSLCVTTLNGIPAKE